jgi:hypothetical protein
MGAFYVNYTVRSTDQKVVVTALAGHRAYVSPPAGGAVVVFEEASEEQDVDVVRELGEQLSKAIKAPVLAVLDHDDDMLWYGLFEGGRCTDEYNSAPGYFDGSLEPPAGGDSRKLCSVFGRRGHEDEVASALRADSETYVFAHERHAALVGALGLPAFAVGCGFTYIEEGELPEGLSADQLLKVG